ncbi:MAG TPA: Ig-like domain-containing protein [Desulfomonilia bacterium]|nr:Ig-like domain-containing protein [Desulfomonilia bacterium]
MKSSASGSRAIIIILVCSLPIIIAHADTWQTVAPTSNNIYALWGTSDNDIYAAGANGTLLHNDGTSWQPISTNTSNDLTSVWGIPSVAVFSVGDQGTIFLNDGIRWLAFTHFSVSHLNALWGTSVTNIYAVGSLGTILFFNGTSWQDASPSTATGIDFNSIWGSAEDDIWVGCNLGKLFHFTGLAWDTLDISSISSQDMMAIWGSSYTDVFAAGTYGNILHFDGTAWKAVHSTEGIDLFALWGSGSDDVFAAGKTGTVLHWDGGTWNLLTGIPSGNDINAVWGSTSGKVYFGCNDGVIMTLSRDDHIAPQVTSSNIQRDNDGNVYISSLVTFLFSEKMKPSTINNTTVTLMAGTTPVSGHLSLSNDGLTLTMKGISAYSTTYNAIIKGGSNGVKDLADNALQSDYSITFTTESPPGQGVEGGGGGTTCFISSALR